MRKIVAPKKNRGAHQFKFFKFQNEFDLGTRTVVDLGDMSLLSHMPPQECHNVQA